MRSIFNSDGMSIRVFTDPNNTFGVTGVGVVHLHEAYPDPIFTGMVDGEIGKVEIGSVSATGGA